MSLLGVTSDVRSIAELLKSGTSYRIPSYQRSYSWQVPDANALLTDLVQAMDEDRSHFLGAVVTCDTGFPDLFEIVDGQQRITTISLLIACLRDAMGDKHKRSELHSYLADDLRPGEWRLTLNHVDAPVFRALAQRPGSTFNAENVVPETSEQSMLIDNLIAIRDEIKLLSERDRIALADFVLHRCPIVHVCVDNRDAGYKVFQVLNTRGRQPTAHDILKTELFERANLSSQDADRLARQWTQHEARLGAKDFDELLRQIRSLHDRQMRGDFVTGFCTSVLQETSPRSFLEEELPRFVDAYLELKQGNVQLSRPMPAVDEHLARLISLDHAGWRAPALQFLVYHPRDADTAREFFCDLERLGFAMQLVITDRDTRARRYRRLSEEVMSDQKLFSPSGALTLTSEEREKLAQRLFGRFGSVTQRRALAIKLNSLLEDGDQSADTSNATVEHILPRNPEPGSEWYEIWPDLSERREICESLGNFCLLSQKDNQRADRLDFIQKRDQFFRRSSRGGRYALTRDAASYDAWTPTTVRDRTERFAKMLIREWKLDLPAG